jgi:hypothetical protein
MPNRLRVALTTVALALSAALPVGAFWACSQSEPIPGEPGTGGPSLSGCVSAGDAATCGGQGCSCHRGFADLDAACNLTCGSPPPDGSIQIDCSESSCDITCTSTCSPNCLQGRCGFALGGTGDIVDCEQSTACNGSVGPGATVNCEQANDCTLVVGQGASVDCLQARTCDITCTGSCSVGCEQTQFCAVHCPGGADASACSGGFACGDAVCN